MAKHTIQLVVKDPVALEAALFPVFVAGTREGRDFRLPHVKAANGEPKQSRSAILRYAIERGVRACIAEDGPTVPALPETTASADAARVIAARGTMTRAECARAAGLKDESSVRNVEARGMALAGKLRAWVESVEAGR